MYQGTNATGRGGGPRTAPHPAARQSAGPAARQAERQRTQAESAHGWTEARMAVTNQGIIRRRGVVGWWLNLTAPQWPTQTLPLAERERLRKSELTSFSILAVFVLLVSLVSNSLAHPATAQAVGVMAVGLVIAAILNRAGKTRTAAYLVPSLLMAVIALAILRAAGGLQLALMPAYDLFALPIFLISLIGHRRASWAFAGAAVTFILVDFALQPHALVSGAGATNFDDIQYAIGQVTWWGEVNRHIALVLFAALFGWLGARSVETAMTRADNAEEVASLEHIVADQKRQLDQGIQQILETHVRVANGDYNARTPMNQDNVLWQIGASLNNLLTRLQKTGQAEYQMQRTEGELRRLAAALDDARSGKWPIWPAPSGTPADLIIERIAAQQQRPATGPMGPMGQSGPLGATPERDWRTPPHVNAVRQQPYAQPQHQPQPSMMFTPPPFTSEWAQRMPQAQQPMAREPHPTVQTAQGPRSTVFGESDQGPRSAIFGENGQGPRSSVFGENGQGPRSSVFGESNPAWKTSNPWDMANPWDTVTPWELSNPGAARRNRETTGSPVPDPPWMAPLEPLER